MALQKYQEYLAAQILNEGRPVNYRLLSRALQVHNNVAKQMLFEFHRAQTARKPNCLHATYLLSGVRKPVDETQTKEENEDVTMKDESFMSSSMPEPEDEDETPEEIPVFSITLAQEENLDEAKKLYSDISSIHVYSLEPGPLQNVQLLSDCSRRVNSEFAVQDPLELWKESGAIRNPHAKRRTTTRTIPAAPITASTTAGMKPTTSKQMEKPGARPASNSQDASKPTKQPPTAKRESSDLFKSFAKTRPVTSASKAKDELMLDADDDEDVSFSELPGKASAKAQAKAEAARKARSDREEKLKQMMEDEDEEAAEDSNDEADQDVDMEEALEAEPTVENPKPVQETEQVTTANGRRRGRRRVMKKKTTKDAEGYLVTKEEAAWESFSEEEKAAPAPAPAQERQASSTKPAAGGNKGAGKKGQGNIMSFFAKN